MSSYNQIAETHTLAETLGLATTEVLALHDEMADLCATIAAQFPDTHEKIVKYQQAYHALAALDVARTVLHESLERINPSDRNRPVTVKVGKQTRRNRAMSQRVRLGNVVARLRNVSAVLPGEYWSDDVGLGRNLTDIIISLDAVTFPQRYG